MRIFRRYLVRFDTTPAELHLKQRWYSDTAATYYEMSAEQKYAPKKSCLQAVRMLWFPPP